MISWQGVSSFPLSLKIAGGVLVIIVVYLGVLRLFKKQKKVIKNTEEKIKGNNLVEV